MRACSHPWPTPIAQIRRIPKLQRGGSEGCNARCWWQAAGREMKWSGAKFADSGWQSPWYVGTGGKELTWVHSRQKDKKPDRV